MFKSNNLIYFIFTAVLVLIFLSNPFLHYPYDMFIHLARLEIYENMESMPWGRKIWYYLWAKTFNILSVPTSDIFLRAKIIHVTQTYIAFFSIYWFSHVVIRNVFKDLDELMLKYLSLWSVGIWFTIFATFSMNYQLVWGLWYSVNYQVTLPFFWYITALTFVLFFENTSAAKKIIYIFLILFFSALIIQIHPMEQLYYILYLLLLVVFYFKRIFFILKKHYFVISLIVISSIYYFTNYYNDKIPAIVYYLKFYELPNLYNEIMRRGEIIINGLNRSYASINELMYLILYIGIVVFIIVAKNRFFNVQQFINNKILVFIILTSLFVLIPLYQFSAGLFGLITHDYVVHRMYYSSSLFVLLPIFVFYIWHLVDDKNIKIYKVNITLGVIILLVIIFSKHYTTNHIYFKNIKSIKDSFDKKIIGFHLSSDEINRIGQIIKKHEIEKKTKKTNFYYARADIEFVIKHIYKKKSLRSSALKHRVYIKLTHTQRYNLDIKKKHCEEYNCILFKTPKNFSNYEPFK